MKTTLLACLCVLLNFFSLAQSPKPRLSESSVVKDADGTIYTFDIARALLMKGAFGVKHLSADTFLLVQLSEAEKLARLERMPKPKESAFFTTGKKVKLPNLIDINGNKLQLNASTGKIVVLNFWFINCPPCRMEIPDLNELVESYKGIDSIEFVAVALDTKRDLKEFLSYLPFNYQIVEEGKYVAERFGIRAYPTHVVLDREGKAYFHTSGLTTNTMYWLKKSIDQLLENSKAAQP